MGLFGGALGGCGVGGYGRFTTTGVILVLFILLVIIACAGLFCV